MAQSMKSEYLNGVYRSVLGYDLPVNNHNGKRKTYRDILLKIDEQMAAMLSHHNKIIVVRFDLHLNDYSQDNRCMSKFVRVYRKRLKANYAIKRMGFVWVREMERAKKQHYHFAVILDGNKVLNSRGVVELAREIWSGRDFGHFQTVKRDYYRIKRGLSANYKEAFSRLSYLAKTRGKGAGTSGKLRAATANDYSTSRIKPKIPFNKLCHAIRAKHKDSDIALVDVDINLQ